MPGQVVDVDSLILNTVGVALAHVLVVPAWRARLRRRKQRRIRVLPPTGTTGTTGHEAPQGSTPTISRVGIAP